MKKLSSLLRQQGFQLFLFGIFCMLLNWPFLTVSSHAGLKAQFIYLFTVWAILIAVIFLITRCLEQDAPPESRQNKKDEPRV
ncbi:MAG: hypothetical protein WC859_08330 [Elusimicrobiota bacterium]|jgi:hypothetical protein